MSDETEMSSAPGPGAPSEETRPEPAVIYTADAPAVVITLNRPERRNAINEAMLDGLHEALDLALDEETVRAVILTGSGSAFCSGLDVHQVAHDAEKPFEEMLADADALARLFRRLRSFEKVTIAAVNGPALASGCGLATLCDFTFATGSARFGYPEVRMGFVPAVVAVYLRYLVSQKRVRDLLLTGRILTADEAQEMGLVSAVVPADHLLEKCRETAEVIARNAPSSIRLTKELLEMLPGMEIDRALKAAVEYNARSRESLECTEGVIAFVEKRDPDWSHAELPAAEETFVPAGPGTEPPVESSPEAPETPETQEAEPPAAEAASAEEPAPKRKRKRKK